MTAVVSLLEKVLKTCRLHTLLQRPNA